MERSSTRRQGHANTWLAPHSLGFCAPPTTSYTEPFIVESTLRDPFGAAYRSPHNVAIIGASDHHAEIRSKAVGLDGDPVIGNADLVFVYNRKLTAIIELKTWWKVNQREIDDVRHGMYFSFGRNTPQADTKAANH